jgi:hypothetical protein
MQHFLVCSIYDDWHIYIIGLQFQLIMIKIQSYIIAISNSTKSNIKLSMTERWVCNIKKYFVQCLRLTFIICHSICQSERKLHSCHLIGLAIFQSKFEWYSWYSHSSLFLSNCYYFNTVSTNFSDLYS